jgi:hypothetical protein
MGLTGGYGVQDVCCYQIMSSPVFLKQVYPATLTLYSTDSPASRIKLKPNGL